VQTAVVHDQPPRRAGTGRLGLTILATNVTGGGSFALGLGTGAFGALI
jgi:hypothetical protein